MHLDRNHGTWTELKAKRQSKFDDAPLESLDMKHNHFDGETHDIQKVKKDRAAKQLTRVQQMFKAMNEYADKKG
jgi:hypothetical protein